MARTGGSLLALVIAVSASMALMAMVQRCFLAPASPSMPSGGMQPRLTGPGSGHDIGQQLMGFGEGDSVALGEGMPLAGLEFAGFEGAVREVKVAMFNKKSTRSDRSQGWTKRKKFRTCSLLARAATVKGRKIIKKRIKRGKHQLAPGDYENRKMMKVKPLR
eukprot:gb/GFBE01050343.1/.p1 GENE.gb/GFBE01050343.1/~~gb/GFBE01050343.1/.p1  ORF type:complete len:162 (+),score=34.88 gb/GFBE01050343.1/:1-486(+)